MGRFFYQILLFVQFVFYSNNILSSGNKFSKANKRFCNFEFQIVAAFTLNHSTMQRFFSILLLAMGLSPLLSQPEGFVSETFMSGFSEAISLAFDAKGRMFVVEKKGRIWLIEDGKRSDAPFLDISQEVSTIVDHGLLSFALDPNFLSNGYCYVYYVVDYHHLINFGTPDYDPGADDFVKATVGRVVRYQAKAEDDFRSIDYESKLILIGESPNTGVPSTHLSHMGGHLVFGTDGSLFLSTGDGGSWYPDPGSAGDTYYEQAIADGIIQADQNIGSFRSQILSSMNGKILRFDPYTGDGLASNPYYDPANPRSSQSRVWSVGLRSAWKMSLRPGTGEKNLASGRPGTLYIGDVGGGVEEELNIATTGGENFGWPFYEGFTHEHLYNENYVPASHTKPIFDWRDGSAPRVRKGNQVLKIGAEFPGPEFGGTSATGGIWYTGTDFPEAYQNTYFFADFGGEWIMNAGFDENDEPLFVREFGRGLGTITCLESSPIDGGLYYVKNDGDVKRIRYEGSSINKKPLVQARANIYYGAAPLTVAFNGKFSSDPEAQPLVYSWDFGDGSDLSSAPNPVHTFTVPDNEPRAYQVKLSVTDPEGALSSSIITIQINNTPPQIQAAELDALDFIQEGKAQNLDLGALVTDKEHPLSSLKFEWETALFHNDHDHKESYYTTPQAKAFLAPLFCDPEASYWYQIKFTVTDPLGLTGVYEKNLYTDCNKLPQTVILGPIGDKLISDPPFSVEAKATSGLPVALHIADGPAYIKDGKIHLIGRPGKVLLRGVQYGNARYNSAIPFERTFDVNPEAGFPTVAITEPEGPFLTESNTINIRYQSWGDLEGNNVSKIGFSLDGSAFVFSDSLSGVFTFNQVEAGDHTVRLKLFNTFSEPLSNIEASDEVSVTLGKLSNCTAEKTEIQALDRKNWRLMYVDGELQEQLNGLAKYALDGVATTFWQSNPNSLQSGFPHEIQLDLGSLQEIFGMTYLPRQIPTLSGHIKSYALYISQDSVLWGEPVSTGIFDISSNEKLIRFLPVQGRYVRLIAYSGDTPNSTLSSIAEFNLLGCVRQKTVSNKNELSRSIKIYPNPFEDNFSIVLDTPTREALDLVIYNQLGQEVLRTVWNTGKQNIDVDTNNLAEGVYYLHLTGEQVFYSERIVKMN